MLCDAKKLMVKRIESSKKKIVGKRSTMWQKNTFFADMRKIFHYENFYYGQKKQYL